VAVAPFAASANTELREVAGGLVANYTNADSLLAAHDFRWEWWSIIALAAPPMLFAGVSLARLASGLRQRNGPAARRKNARQRALATLRQIHRDDPRRLAQTVVAVIGDYVADRLNLSTGSLTSEEIVQRLRSSRISEQDVNDAQRLLAECEQSAYSGGINAGGSGDDWQHRAADLIKRLDRSRFA